MNYSTYDNLYSDYDISAYARTAPDMAETISSADMTVSTITSVVEGFAGLIIVLALVISILQIVANWKIFVKAGEKGWKSIIPYYNTAILFKISGLSPWLVLLCLGMFIPVVNFLVSIAFLVLQLIQTIKLAKAFRKSGLFTVGMIFLPSIFNLILAFGDSEYYGFDEVKST